MNKIPQVGQLVLIKNLAWDYGQLHEDYKDSEHKTKFNGLFKVEKVDFITTNNRDYGDTPLETFYVDLYLLAPEPIVYMDDYNNETSTIFIKLTLADKDAYDIWEKCVKLLPPGETSELLYA